MRIDAQTFNNAIDAMGTEEIAILWARGSVEKPGGWSRARVMVMGPLVSAATAAILGLSRNVP